MLPFLPNTILQIICIQLQFSSELRLGNIFCHADSLAWDCGNIMQYWYLGRYIKSWNIDRIPSTNLIDIIMFDSANHSNMVLNFQYLGFFICKITDISLEKEVRDCYFSGLPCIILYCMINVKQKHAARMTQIVEIIQFIILLPFTLVST